MKRIISHLLIALALLAALSPKISPAYAQGTVFTYQGRLDDGGNLVGGDFDFIFTLWTNASGPAQVSSEIAQTAIPVSNGLFTLRLDFGAGVFTGADRWLEISVRTNDGGGFSILSPRQRITATPYAMFAAALPASSITSNMLAPGAVGSTQLATGAVQAANIAAGAVTAVQLAKPPRSGSV